MKRSIAEGDGLPGSTVRGVTQDGSGRIWFATRAGVAGIYLPASDAEIAPPLPQPEYPDA